MQELVRIPLLQVKAGAEIKVRAFIPPSKVGENTAGKRFFQASMVRTGSTKWMLPWDSNLVRVIASQDGKELVMKPTSLPFYLHSSDSSGSLGLAFSPEMEKDCDITVRFLGKEYPANGELVIAPNWPNAMFLKDQMVGAMLSPAFDMVKTWMNRIGLLLSLAVSVLLFSITTKRATDLNI